MNSRVIERATGAQILPDIRDKLLKDWNSYYVHLACDADLRTKVQAWRDRASEIEVRGNGDS